MKLEFSFKSKDNFCNYSNSTEELRNRYGLTTGITIGNSFNVYKGTAVSATVTSASAPAAETVPAAVAEADLFGVSRAITRLMFKSSCLCEELYRP